MIVEKHLKETFEDSNQRFTKGVDTKYNYVFLEKFTIQLKVQVTLNKSQALALDINFKEPDLLLSLVLGSETAENEFLSIELEEE